MLSSEDSMVVLSSDHQGSLILYNYRALEHVAPKESRTLYHHSRCSTQLKHDGATERTAPW